MILWATPPLPLQNSVLFNHCSLWIVIKKYSHLEEQLSLGTLISKISVPLGQCYRITLFLRNRLLGSELTNPRTDLSRDIFGISAVRITELLKRVMHNLARKVDAINLRAAMAEHGKI